MEPVPARFGAGSDFGLPIPGKLLGHKESATTQPYAPIDNDLRRRAHCRYWRGDREGAGLVIFR